MVSSLVTAAALLLNRRAGHGAVGTEYTAVARFWAKQGFAADALVEELAGIRRHGFLLLPAALRAGDDRLQKDFAHALRALRNENTLLDYLGSLFEARSFVGHSKDPCSSIVRIVACASPL